MKNRKSNRFSDLKFNLKNEFFLFFHAMKIIKFIYVSKSFKLSVQKFRWFRLIKENFKKILLESSVMFSEMEGINNLLID